MVLSIKKPTVETRLEARIAGLASRRAESVKLRLKAAPRQEPAIPPAPEVPPESPIDDHLSTACWEIIGVLRAEISPEQRAVLSRRQLAKIVGAAVEGYVVGHAMAPGKFTRGELASSNPRNQLRAVETAKAVIQPLIHEQMDVATAVNLPRATFEARLAGWVRELLASNRIQLNFTEECALVEALVADMLGLGPLEPLLADDTVSDIMVNGPKQVYVERRGKLELTDATFRDES